MKQAITSKLYERNALDLWQFASMNIFVIFYVCDIIFFALMKIEPWMWISGETYD